MKRWSLIAFSLLLVLATSGIAAATPAFLNNSFENFVGDDTSGHPDLYEDVTFNDGWTAVNENDRLDVFSVEGYNASDGNAALRVHPTIDGAQQALDGFTIGQTYDLIFDMAPSAVWSSEFGEWNNASDAGQGVEIFINDVSIGTAATTSDFSSTAVFGQNPFDYTTYRLTFTALAEELTFRFDILDADAEGGVALDNIRLAETSDIPEPSSLVLLAIGLLVVAVAARQRCWHRAS